MTFWQTESDCKNQTLSFYFSVYTVEIAAEGFWIELLKKVLFEYNVTYINFAQIWFIQDGFLRYNLGSASLKVTSGWWVNVTRSNKRQIFRAGRHDWDES